MRTTPQRYYHSQVAKRLLTKVVGAHGWMLLLVVFLLVLLDWFTSAAWTFFEQVLGAVGGQKYLLVCGVSALPAALFLLYLLARRAPAEQRPKIKEYSHPRQVRALVMFLSTPPKRPNVMYEIADGKQQVGGADDGALASIGPWRMPLAAISYHAEQDRRMSRFEVRSLQELIVASRIGSSSSHDYSQGVDFESANDIEEAVTVAYQALHKLGIPDQDILVDITGGQKPASVAGAVVALGVNRRMQYVSTHDYRVRVYDVTFDE